MWSYCGLKIETARREEQRHRGGTVYSHREVIRQAAVCTRRRFVARFPVLAKEHCVYDRGRALPPMLPMHIPKLIVERASALERQQQDGPS